MCARADRYGIVIASALIIIQLYKFKNQNTQLQKDWMICPIPP